MIGWKTAKLGDVTSIITKGTTPTTVGYQYVDQGVNFVKVEAIAENSTLIPAKFAKVSEGCHNAFKRSQIADGDILFSIAGALGRCAIASEAILPANTNQAVAIVRLSDRSSLLPEYVLYALKSDAVAEQIERDRAGSAQQNLSLSQLTNFTIPIPPPEEQRRIVAVLDEAFAAIATATDNAEKNLANARELPSAALIQSGFAGASFDRRRLGSLVTRLTNGYVGPTRDIYIEEGVPYLLARHVRDDTLVFDGRTFVSSEFNEKNRKSKLRAGDVLLVQSGHIGHSAVVPPRHAGDNCHAMIVMTPTADISGEYISAYLNSVEGMAATASIRTGSTVPHLTCKDVKELKIPVPTIEAQGLLLARHREMKSFSLELQRTYRSKITELKTLKQSLLSRAFTGALTAAMLETIAA